MKFFSIGKENMASAWITFAKQYYLKNKSKGISYKTALVEAGRLWKSQKAGKAGKKAKSKKVVVEGAKAPKKKRRRRKRKAEE